MGQQIGITYTYMCECPAKWEEIGTQFCPPKSPKEKHVSFTVSSEDAVEVKTEKPKRDETLNSVID